MNDVLIFFNPIAGRGRARGLAERISRSLAGQGVRAHLFDRPAYTIGDAELQFPQPPAAMIVIGGDGTLRGAVERMLWLGRGDASKIPPVLPIALGTANLMARHLGMKWSDEGIEMEVVRFLQARNLIHVDAGLANDRLFLLMVGVGIDAAIVHELDNLRRGPIDLTSYALPSLLAIQKYEYPPLKVTVEGRVVLDGEPAMAFAGNVPEYGTGFPILTRARPDDGLLDVCILPCSSRAQVLRLLMAAATGDHMNEEGVMYMKARSIEIESPQSVPVQLDGEASGHTPIEVRLLPTRVPFIVPREVGSRR